MKKNNVYQAFLLLQTLYSARALPLRAGALALASVLASAILLAGCAQTPESSSSGAGSMTGSGAQAAPSSSQTGSEQTGKQPASSGTQTANVSSRAANVSSKTKTSVAKAEDEVVFDANKYKDQMKKAEQLTMESCYAYDSSTIEKLIQNSTELLTCKVEKADFVTIWNGQPHTKTTVKVLQSFKGNVKPGDRIVVYNNGGYITMDDYIKTRGLEVRFPNATKQERLNTVYEMKNSDAQDERYPQAGDQYFYGLRTDPSLNGGYFPTTEHWTTYRMDNHNRCTRFYDHKAKQKKTPSDNSVESFTLDWFKTKLAELQ